MTDTLDQYIRDHIDAEDPYLHALYRATHLRTVHGRMASGHLQGLLLRTLVEMVRPQHIVEVGTFSGYSAICMARGLKRIEADGHRQHPRIHTFEVNDEMEDFTRSWIEGSDVAPYIDFRIGDAATDAPQLGIRFDMAFIDGDKRNYTETFQKLLPVMAPRAWVIADNTLWDGHVTDPDYDHDAQTIGIRCFNDYIAGQPQLEKIILPLRDGLTIIRTP